MSPEAVLQVWAPTSRRVGVGQASGQSAPSTANLVGHFLTGALGGAVAGAVVGWLIKKPVESVAVGAGVGGVASYLLNK